MTEFSGQNLQNPVHESRYGYPPASTLILTPLIFQLMLILFSGASDKFALSSRLEMLRWSWPGMPRYSAPSRDIRNEDELRHHVKYGNPLVSTLYLSLYALAFTHIPLLLRTMASNDGWNLKMMHAVVLRASLCDLCAPCSSNTVVVAAEQWLLYLHVTCFVPPTLPRCLLV